MTITPAAIEGVTLMAGALLCIGAHHLGVQDGKAIVVNQATNAAAESCPTCGKMDEAAERLDAIGARISGVEYYGDPIGGSDPVDDANSILRVARTHSRRARLHRTVFAKDADAADFKGVR